MTSVTNSNYYDYINHYVIKNPYVFLSLALVFLFYLILIKYLGQKNNTIDISGNNDSGTIEVFKDVFAAFILFLIVINALKYIFQIDISFSINDLFKKIPKINIDILNGIGKATKEIEKEGENIIKEGENILLGGVESVEQPEVFNIPDNIYTYDDAKALCKAYNSKLANYNEIEEAYEDGGEWCNYGWSSDQMILYPTQKKTYKKLKNIKGHEHDCGRPGVNGGYIANPQAKFGVNCFGIKPKINEKEKELMDINNIYPDTKKDRCERRKINKFRKYLKDITISPFNRNTWYE